MPTAISTRISLSCAAARCTPASRLADLPAAIQSLAAAIRQDPQFAAAYVLLARARVELAERESPEGANAGLAEAVENALQLLDTAIELEPANGEAYVERGYLKAFYDIAAADADFRRGIELAPNSSRGYEGLAAVLFQSVARRREALAMLEKARKLNPLEPRLDVVKATYLGYGPGDAEQATRLLQQVLERDPLYLPALLRLAEFRWSLQGRNSRDHSPRGAGREPRSGQRAGLVPHRRRLPRRRRSRVGRIGIPQHRAIVSFRTAIPEPVPPRLARGRRGGVRNACRQPAAPR